jgi:ubiquinone/menaquinone biosynthesis C-methylase UbiE
VLEKLLNKIKNKLKPLFVLWRRFIFNENNFTALQKVFYSTGTSNHLEHNANKDYWSILLKPLNNASKYKGKNALDFACGKGRNITNLMQLANWRVVDGADISKINISYCESNFPKSKHSFFCTNGIDLANLKSDYYDFVMSTIALQHIPVYNIRNAILMDIYRVMRINGTFTFQMGYGTSMNDQKGRRMAGYYENLYNARGTNSDHDVQVTSVNEIKNHLLKIGFNRINVTIRPSFSDVNHKEWIYIVCLK